MLKKEIIAVYKKLGLTPLQTIELVRKKYPELNKETIGYAGRLDPMAEGILLLMIGVGNKKGEKYKNLDKTYAVEFFFGASTDSYDVLGLINSYSNKLPINIDLKIQTLLQDFRGKRQQKLPPYSSIRVHGKKLFQWAREHKLGEIKIPSREITMYNIAFKGAKSVSSKNLHRQIKEQVSLVFGDFRQEEILRKWNEYFSKTNQKEYSIFSLEVHCSSGTYMRSVVKELGEKIGCPATCLRIIRTRAGEYSIIDAVKI